MSCGAGDPVDTTSEHAVELGPRQSEFTLRAGDGVKWRLTTTYVRVETTPWAVNENGDTYGVANNQGDPDLMAVVATNGNPGYVYTSDLDGPTPTSPADALAQQENSAGPIVLPVYDSDGETEVGEFVVQVGQPG